MYGTNDNLSAHAHRHCSIEYYWLKSNLIPLRIISHWTPRSSTRILKSNLKRSSLWRVTRPHTLSFSLEKIKSIKQQVWVFEKKLMNRNEMRNYVFTIIIIFLSENFNQKLTRTYVLQVISLIFTSYTLVNRLHLISIVLIVFPLLMSN